MDLRTVASKVAGQMANNYLMQFLQEAVWFRFFNPKQVEHPDYPPLPPKVVLEDVGVLVNDLLRLAMMGVLP
jgi:hypothetical protein